MIVPEAHMGACMELATQRRGIYRCKTAEKPPHDPHHLLFFYLDLLYVYKKNMAFQRFWTIYKSLKVCSFIVLRFTRTTNFLTQGRTLLEYEFLGNKIHVSLSSKLMVCLLDKWRTLLVAIGGCKKFSEMVEAKVG